MKPIDVDRIRAVLAYDADTGLFTWKAKTYKSVRIGSIAGAVQSAGYIQICIDRDRHYAHRLAWAYVHGVDSFDEIDHINGCRSDNRLSNLRVVHRFENMQNTCGPRIDSRSGVRGVQKHGRKFRAIIKADGVTHRLGSFDTLELAQDAYERARKALHLSVAQ